MNQIELIQLLNENSFYSGLKVGFSKFEIENILGKPLPKADIETPDLSLYYLKLGSGIVLTSSFDINEICFDISIDFKLNENLKLVFKNGNKKVIIDEDSTFDHLVDFLSQANIKWEFDRKRVYLQTCCIKVENGLRFYYAFGDKQQNDYGLFAIKSILENHNLTTL